MVIFRLHNSVIWYFIINVLVFVCVCYYGDFYLNWTHVFKGLVPSWYCYGGLWNFEDGVEQLEDIYYWGWAWRLHKLATLSIWASCSSVQLKCDVLASGSCHQNIIPWQISSTLVTSQMKLLLKLGFGSLHIIRAKEK